MTGVDLGQGRLDLLGLSLDDRGAQERLRTLSNELREAVQDRFEQLELLPFRRP